MLCFPIDKKPDWRRPPVVTTLLIIINILCFLFFQLNDEEEAQVAHDFYFSSGLADIELPYYHKYLIKNGTYEEIDYISKAKGKLSKEDFDRLLSWQMHADGEFSAKLNSFAIIKKTDNNYGKWKQLRPQFVKRQNDITYYRYGLKPSRDDIETYLTSTFLHAGFGHLFGNMVFLFLFGFIVEKTIGWKMLFPAYIIAGLGSGLVYVLMEPDSILPGIGASGAIAGLAGMYTVLFGFRKVRFFVHLLVYFDTIKLPAIIMLPVWLGYEFYSHYFIDSGINNLAHAGGYISGAIIIAVMKFTKQTINEDYLNEEEQRATIDNDYTQAQKYLAALELDKAKALFTKLENKLPDDINIKVNLYNICKIKPASKNYHYYAGLLLSYPNTDAHIVSIQKDTFSDYIQNAKPKPQLNVSQLVKLAVRFYKRGYHNDVDAIINILIRNNVKNSEFIELLAMLASADNHSDNKKSVKYRAMLARIEPDRAKQVSV